VSLQDRTGLLQARIFNEAARLRDEFDGGDLQSAGEDGTFNGACSLPSRISAA
jgi:hypothetical protein